jgi:hypothetical protein
MTPVNSSSPQNASLTASARTAAVPASGKLANGRCVCLCNFANSICNFFGYYKKEALELERQEEENTPLKEETVVVEQPGVVVHDLSKEVAKRLAELMKEVAKPHSKALIDTATKQAADASKEKSKIPIFGCCIQRHIDSAAEKANKALTDKSAAAIDNGAKKIAAAIENGLRPILGTKED